MGNTPTLYNAFWILDAKVARPPHATWYVHRVSSLPALQALTCRLGAPAHLCDERAFSYPGRILRWYKEVDKDGKELSGYQNKECVAYKITLNNDGVPFQWTPNLQLISKVYLKKNLSQGRTYTLKKKDAKMVKMVKAGVAKKL